MNNNILTTVAIFIAILILGSCQNKSTQESNQKEDSTSMTEMNSETEIIFVGTYTRKEGHVDGKAEGIYVYSFDKNSGKLEKLHTMPGIINPSYLTVHPNQSYLYAASEIVGNDSIDGGLIYAYKINDDYSLTQINTSASEGGAPCYVSVHPNGKYVLAANYVGGNVSLFPIGEDGGLSKASSVIQHEGSGPTDRQEAPHAHMVATHQNNIFAADLGVDKVFTYKLDEELSNLGLIGEAEVEGGSGPRHIDFHPSKNWAYVLNELSGTVTAFTIDENSLSAFQTISSLEEGKSDAGSADIHITPNGKFLYATNRYEHNNIAMYMIDQENGTLELIGHQSTKGRTPRNFVIDPSGEFLLVANQDSDNVITFKIDPETGKLIDTGIETQIPTPVCLKFL